MTHDEASNHPSDDISAHQQRQGSNHPTALTPQNNKMGDDKVGGDKMGNVEGTPSSTSQDFPQFSFDTPSSNALSNHAPSSSSPNSTPSSGWLSGKLGVLIGVGIGLVLGVAVVPRLIGSNQPSRADTTSETPAVTAQDSTLSTQSVTVATVGSTQIQRTLEATGTVIPSDLLPILAKSSGLQIQQVLVDEGDRVVAGQPLALLDQSVLRTEIAGAEADLEAARARVIQREAALAQAKARLAEAQANLERYDNLSSQGAVSEQEFDTRATTAATAQEDVRVAEANISSALADVRSEEAQLERLNTQLGQAIVTAPADGIVAERFARVGDVTSGSQALFTVIRDRLLELDVNIPETQLPAIRLGSTVAIRSDADPRLQIQGQVQEISPLIDPQTREASVKINLPDSAKLRSGMFLRASLTTGVVQGLTLPAAAVLPQSDGNALVYRVGPDSHVQAQPIVLGELLDGGNPETATIEILQGLQAGDRIVVEGASYLKDGDAINIVQN
ncbi:MAG: efflux RND transporter periplasmic adaptor subunit [Symploca sp. SIO2B6]|nr:efflux RND transporter periplasmic adaptor subunit [Symploca sp. SIO2B6]